MAMLVGSQTRLLKAEHFAAWQEALRELAREHKRQEVAEEMQALRQRQEESRRKFVMAMTEGQAAHGKEMLKSVVSAWRAHLSDLRKQQKAAERTMALLLGGQVRLVLQETFHSWAKVAKEAHAKWRHARKSMAMLVGSQTRLLMAEHFAAWAKERQRQKVAEE